MNLEKLLASLKQHEGRSLTAYQDSRGIWTIGYGRNLQNLKITPGQADAWLVEDLNTAAGEAAKFSEFSYLNTEARRNAFIEMVFNMGSTRVKGFAAMLKAIRMGWWNLVAEEALNSQWAKQVGERANQLAEMFRTGVFPT